MKIESKYDIGDVVYHPHVKVAEKRIPCPDCLGKKTWHATLPNGDELDFSCPTCTSGYEVLGTISDWGATGWVKKLTIGQIRYNDFHDGFSYMCEETGTGSGAVWDESRLYPTEEEAAAALPELIRQMQVAWEEQRARQARGRKEPATMAGYYRRQIAQAKKDIESAERGLAREAGKES